MNREKNLEDAEEQEIPDAAKKAQLDKDAQELLHKLLKGVKR